MKFKHIEEKEEKKYPWIGIADDGEIILFNEPDCGIILKGTENPKWHYGEGWNEDMFKPLKGEVILSND